MRFSAGRRSLIQRSAVVGLAALAALAGAAPAEARDWQAFRAGFSRLISMHCAAKWVVHPEQVAPCIAEQQEAMLRWTGAMGGASLEPRTAFVLTACRSRWSAMPHTNWVKAVACADVALNPAR